MKATYSALFLNQLGGDPSAPLVVPTVLILTLFICCSGTHQEFLVLLLQEFLGGTTCIGCSVDAVLSSANWRHEQHTHLR
uniref:Uncharacterized protein n=1 Tax=Arundo donax TaxID=35708 RepID=A0A0A9GMA3_ARUDO